MHLLRKMSSLLDERGHSLEIGSVDGKTRSLGRASDVERLEGGRLPGGVQGQNLDLGGVGGENEHEAEEALGSISSWLPEMVIRTHPVQRWRYRCQWWQFHHPERTG